MGGGLQEAGGGCQAPLPPAGLLEVRHPVAVCPASEGLIRAAIACSRGGQGGVVMGMRVRVRVGLWGCSCASPCPYRLLGLGLQLLQQGLCSCCSHCVCLLLEVALQVGCCLVWGHALKLHLQGCCCCGRAGRGGGRQRHWEEGGAYCPCPSSRHRCLPPSRARGSHAQRHWACHGACAGPSPSPSSSCCHC